MLTAIFVAVIVSIFSFGHCIDVLQKSMRLQAAENHNLQHAAMQQLMQQQKEQHDLLMQQQRELAANAKWDHDYRSRQLKGHHSELIDLLLIK